MKAPPNAPRIFRDHDRLYLQWDSGTTIPFEFSQSGLHKALKQIPIMPGSKAELKRQMKPDWAITQAKDKNGHQVIAKVAPKTLRDRVANKASPELKRAADEAFKKLLEKK